MENVVKKTAGLLTLLLIIIIPRKNKHALFFIHRIDTNYGFDQTKTMIQKTAKDKKTKTAFLFITNILYCSFCLPNSLTLILTQRIPWLKKLQKKEKTKRSFNIKAAIAAIHLINSMEAQKLVSSGSHSMLG